MQPFFLPPKKIVMEPEVISKMPSTFILLPLIFASVSSSLEYADFAMGTEIETSMEDTKDPAIKIIIIM